MPDLKASENNGNTVQSPIRKPHLIRERKGECVSMGKLDEANWQTFRDGDKVGVVNVHVIGHATLIATTLTTFQTATIPGPVTIRARSLPTN